MKKIATFVLTCLTLFGLASCNDDVEYGDPVTARISVSAPQDVVARAQAQTGYGDTWSAMKLAYTIYRTDGTIVLDEVIDFDASNEAHFDAVLAKGASYNIAFFAYADGSPYTYDGATCTVTTTYGSGEYEGNSELLDAFYKYATYEITNNFSATVVLTRAVAQLNLLTSEDDYNECTNFYTPSASSIKIKSLYPQFDLKQGLAVGTPVDMTFKGDITNELANSANRPFADYKWLAMNYFFTNEELVNVEATIYAEDDTEMVKVMAFNAPVQKNFRTNIYGDILTNNTSFTVIKSDEWLDNYDVEVIE